MNCLQIVSGSNYKQEKKERINEAVKNNPDKFPAKYVI